MNKDELKDEMKNKISMALKDPILQQGFEIICNENEQIEHLREERNYFQEKCEDIELNYYCDHKGGCKVQELEKEFQDGAEYGYNKANEWHYVKDGDLPDEDVYVYLLFRGQEYPMVARRHLFKEWGRLKWCWDCKWGSGYTIEADNDKIIAWKEIVLPKEIEK